MQLKHFSLNHGKKMQKPRSIRLFNPDILKLTQSLSAVDDYASQKIDESMVWERTDIENIDFCNEVGFEDIVNNNVPLSLRFAPEDVKKSGYRYAKWCILVSALAFQINNIETFLLRLSEWWSKDMLSKKTVPYSNIGWSAIFDDKDESVLDSRKEILSELLSSKFLDTICKGWEEKISFNREFNDFDAANLAKLLPKSFYDPFLNKSCRAIWQFTSIYKKRDRKISVKLSPPSNPDLFLIAKQCGMSDCNKVVEKKLNGSGFLRDEASELAIRSFLIKYSKRVSLCFQINGYELHSNRIKSKTTDY